jgi:REP element-mobilizing transposase RayT
MSLSAYGEIVQEEWLASAKIRQEIALDVFVIMPNHVHGIVWLENANGNPPAPPTIRRSKGLTARSIGAFVAGFKAAVTKRINTAHGTPGGPVWQRNYYERVIRNERELDAIRTYIAANPAQWGQDPEQPGG